MNDFLIRVLFVIAVDIIILLVTNPETFWDAVETLTGATIGAIILQGCYWILWSTVAP